MGYTSRNRVQMVRGGKEFFSRLQEMIGKASHSIHLQFYIFLDDETGLAVIRSLQGAAARGVAVYLQLDAFASRELSQKSVDALREAGVEVKWFEPLFKSRHFYFGRRLHHKVVVVDVFWSMVGGINIVDR